MTCFGSLSLERISGKPMTSQLPMDAFVVARLTIDKEREIFSSLKEVGCGDTLQIGKTRFYWLKILSDVN